MKKPLALLDSVSDSEYQGDQNDFLIYGMEPGPDDTKIRVHLIHSSGSWSTVVDYTRLTFTGRLPAAELHRFRNTTIRNMAKILGI